jgi:hypothetical protein
MHPPPDLQHRLLFILHRGLVEIRFLGLGGHAAQAAELADALELLPGWIDRWEDMHLAALRFNLETYTRKYPHSFEFLRRIEEFDVPARF